jgi:hypothetical protein
LGIRYRAMPRHNITDGAGMGIIQLTGAVEGFELTLTLTLSHEYVGEGTRAAQAPPQGVL